MPAASSVFGPVVGDLQRLSDKWDSVTEIPGLGLPIIGAPWILVLAGAALVLVGVLGVLRPARVVTAGILVLGVGMTVVPFALSLPEKSSDSREVLKVGRVALSQPAATAAHRTALAVDGMVGELKTNMLPDLARRLSMSRAGLDRMIARDFPGLARGLREWPAIAPAAYGLAATQQASIDDFKRIDGIGYAGLEWLAVGPGIVLVLLAGAALWTGRERRSRSSRPSRT